ncbi:DNA binding [Ascochyta rabiei]|uniref:DNA binding n=1 Tax=Didymella rabiei TaxID=5454 RepID=A0A162W1R3_DIDRA|nr:DNA binding [Ascochyta rabiei]
MLMPRSDVLKRHVRGHTAQDDDNEADDIDIDDNDNDGPRPPGRASPAFRRSTLRSPQRSDTPADGYSELVQSMNAADSASLDMTQQQLTSLDDFSTVLGLPHTPASAVSADRSDERRYPMGNTAWLSALSPAVPSSPGLSGLSDLSNPWDAFLLSMSPPVPSDAISIPSRKHSLGSDIPDERFTKLAGLWPKKREPQWPLIQTLWTDAACYKGTNLFSEYSPRTADNYNNDDGSLLSLPNNGLQRGLDDARRLSLIQFMLPNLGTERDYEWSRNSRFPTVDTLAVCIDYYFQRFHPLFPFIHEPTFSARQTPNIMLAPICLIGLHLLDPDTTRPFVANQMLRSNEKCTVALSKTWERPDWNVLVTVLGAAVLLLNYASVLETYNLYVRALTVALQSGLFDVSRGPPLARVLSHEQLDDHFWEGRAKIESAKRLIACLVATDLLYTTRLGSKPIVHVDRLNIYAPCSNHRFNMPNANGWEDLASAINMSCMNSCISDFQCQSIANTVAMHTLLSASSLCIADLKASNLMHDTDPEKNILYPAESFQYSAAGPALVRLLWDINIYHGEGLLASDPNATVLWHNMCMNMSANLNLFELAAGREGVKVAKVALEKILVWAHSPYSRRACLHAAQVYVCMMKRRITDGTMFMSEVALFNAALVVGLYVYASPSTLQGGTEPPLELLDQVDWSQIGDGGLPGWSPSQNNPAYAASRFISKGTPISFNKMVCHGGYMSSRRILLNYVGLLEEVGRWNWRKFRHILRIMADSMVELE